MTAKITVFIDVMPCSYVSTKAHNTASKKAVISSSSLCMGTTGDRSYIFSDIRLISLFLNLFQINLQLIFVRPVGIIFLTFLEFYHCLM
jgi:hypothetical protein